MLLPYLFTRLIYQPPLRPMIGHISLSSSKHNIIIHEGEKYLGKSHHSCVWLVEIYLFISREKNSRRGDPTPSDIDSFWGV